MIARTLVIAGWVQGVGYRDAMIVVARAAGVAGWVCNRRDGTVEARVQGDSAAVAKVTAWCHHGPPAARVIAIEATAAEPDFALNDFGWRATR